MKAVWYMHKIDKSETVIDYIYIDFTHFGTKRNCWNKAQIENRNKTKYVALTNTKARLHQNNATQQKKRKRKQKQMRKHVEPTKSKRKPNRKAERTKQNT